MITWWMAVIVAYTLGSIPSALIYSHFRHGRDIRTLGDGNMGARNTKRQFGWRAGVLVCLVDILKGTLAVFLAKSLFLPAEWQLLCGAAAILGHDFPIFAHFRGGQGFATTTGVFLGLFPIITIVGGLIYFVLYLVTHSSDLAASIGMGYIAVASYIKGFTFLELTFIVTLLLFIPYKKWLGRSRIVLS